MRSRSRSAGKVLLVLMALCAASCSDAADDIDQFSDCIEICGRYQECFDEDYDTDACADRCEAMDRRNDQTEIDQCDNCLDDRSCAESVFPCALECSDIVP